MAGRATTPQGRKLGNINNMPNRKYLPSINFSVPFARWSHFYVSIDWTKVDIEFFKLCIFQYSITLLRVDEHLQGKAVLLGQPVYRCFLNASTKKLGSYGDSKMSRKPFF
jgi:hypothetical protein